MCNVNLNWLYGKTMLFQSNTHISPLFNIESPVAQWLLRLARSARAGDGFKSHLELIIFGVDAISTFKNVKFFNSI